MTFKYIYYSYIDIYHILTNIYHTTHVDSIIVKSLLSLVLAALVAIPLVALRADTPNVYAIRGARISSKYK